MEPPLRRWVAHSVLGVVPILLWAGFHLWEQWAAFFGRDAFVSRLAATSRSPTGVALQVVILIAIAAFAYLELTLRRSAEPEPLALALAERPEAARRLARLARVGTWALLAFVAYHALWLAMPRLAGGDALEAWLRLRQLGSWSHAALHAIGLTGLAIHLWTALPRMAIALGWAQSPETRRGARVSALLVAALFLLLYGQLAGLHASGTGTLWSL
ncbi:MAG: hypothetical protein IT378_06870 [Sandaracinaceae bacterium]|nr:hypothetical protein [Sandaracinaceae bacterium]